MSGYPIELDLTGRAALVVGLGPVGRRKAAGLVEAGARVLGIEPDPAAAGLAPAGVEVRVGPYEPAHLEGMGLAFAAATAEVNRRVMADARRAGVWVSSASEPGSGDFLVPAVWREGPLVLTVSTSGASPALAALLRDRAAEALGPAAAALATLLAEFRPLALARVGDPEARRRLLEGWADPRLLELAASEGPEAVRRVLRAGLDAAAGPGPSTRGGAGGE